MTAHFYRGFTQQKYIGTVSNLTRTGQLSRQCFERQRRGEKGVLGGEGHLLVWVQ